VNNWGGVCKKKRAGFDLKLPSFLEKRLEAGYVGAFHFLLDVEGSQFEWRSFFNSDIFFGQEGNTPGIDDIAAGFTFDIDGNPEGQRPFSVGLQVELK
jgi:hypothetical protein